MNPLHDAIVAAMTGQVAHALDLVEDAATTGRLNQDAMLALMNDPANIALLPYLISQVAGLAAMLAAAADMPAATVVARLRTAAGRAFDRVDQAGGPT